MQAISRWLRSLSDDTTGNGIDLNHRTTPAGVAEAGWNMPSTYLSLHYHLVFSTKERRPWIDESWRPRLHEYLGGTVQGLGGYSQGIGGVADHVHLLVGLKATHCLSDFMREVKKASSVWVHEEIR